jgi:pyruvate/2-oxoglutarate dehydrogenase complex dihydrolipoamide acyltransferase (E2) component
VDYDFKGDVLMVTNVVMPNLSTLDYIMEKGEIVEWYKEEGEPVEEGEPILEIMTAKVSMEVNSPATGILKEILVKKYDEAPPGAVLAIIE